MTWDQENAESGAESGKALFDLISDLSAGYRTNAVLTAGLHLAASALVSSALTHWSKRSSMQSSHDGNGGNGARSLDRSMQRRIFP